MKRLAILALLAIPLLAQTKQGDTTFTGTVTGVNSVGGVTISGTPSVGYIPTATSSSAATWQVPSGGCTISSTSTCIEDEFLSGTETAGAVGSLGWYWSAVGSGQPYVGIGSTAGHPGYVSLTGFASADAVRMSAKPVGTYSFLMSETWDAVFIFRSVNSDGTTATSWSTRLGLLDSPATFDPPANGVYVESLSTDTNYFFVARSGSASDTRQDTGVAKGTGWPKVEIQRVNSTTVGITVNGGSQICITSAGSLPTGCSSGLTSATHLPTGNAVPFAMGVQTASGTKELDIDYFKLTISGLSR